MSDGQGTVAYTGRARRKKTRWSVRAADFAAKWTISIGGIATIVAVSLVFLFLFAVAVPLFLPAYIEDERRMSVPGGSVLADGVDEFRRLYWSVSATGELQITRLDTGQLLWKRPLLNDGTPSAISQPPTAREAVIGGTDGSLRIGSLGFASQVVTSSELVPPAIRALAVGEFQVDEQAFWERMGTSQWRRQEFVVGMGTPVMAGKSAIRQVDHLILTGQDDLSPKSYLVALAAEDGSCTLCKVAEEENQFSGEKSLVLSSYPLPAHGPSVGHLLRVLIAGRGENVYIVWTSGLVQRLVVRDPEQLTIAEAIDTLADLGGQLTDACLLLGRETLVLADSRGGLRAWFRTRRQDVPTRDGLHLSLVHDLSQPGAGFTSLRSSERGRMIVAGGQDGMVRVFQVTTEKQVLARAAVSGTRVDRVLMAPKEDGLLAKAGDTLWIANFAARHPEVTWTSLFGKVWYEGYDEPQYMWQSSYATSAPEMKLSLAPLVFGTVKATFYTMLFAAPLALLAAIYSSEFMHPRVRIWVKPAIEMMASLPSVVLGFLAALVFAPVVEGHVTAAISGLYLTPVMYLFAAHLWQALPQRLLVRWTRFRLVLLAIPLPLSVVSSLQLEPMIERWLFAGNITRWLDGQTGTGVGAWLLLLLPLCAVGTTVVIVTQINPRLRTFLGDCTRAQSVALGLLKFMLATALTVLLAVMMSWLLDQAGWDPRGSFVSTYTQRNALIVGAVMGFAVIPIIYTIADDALSTVPQHLRSASLGCGATEWQTAIRVVVPTAMSGLFSALMIGLGRAVGETMIVLMAGGNTPVMEWNPFNGFRTLSANIATELPEAVRDSTHYRTLFFAALTLFLLTFFLNTIAELVRIRFRRRAYQL